MSQAFTALLMLLSLYDRPPTPQELQAAGGKDPAAVLLVIADSPAVPAWQQRRAVDALGWFPDDRVRGRLLAMMAEDVAAADGQSKAPRRLHRVIYSLTRGWGIDAEADLKPLYGHSDPQIQDTVDHALAKARGERR